MKPKTGRTTKVISIRVPIPLYDRINTLACKQVKTKNAWCIMTLERECKPRN
jgi:predicted DNA-binding protein